MRREEGYTLVEMVVVTLIFSVAMTLICASFNRIVASSGQVLKAAETDIGDLIGLELLRVDLGLAGFGLPWSLGGATYDGESQSHIVNGLAKTDAASFNDGSSRPPRALVTLNDQGFNGSDYLVLKGTALGTSGTSRTWSYLNYSSSTAILKQSKSEVELAPGKGDKVIVLNAGAKDGAAFRDLVTDGSVFSFSIDDIPPAFQPKGRQDSYLVFGLTLDDPVGFPFNRADYYLGLPNDPKPPRNPDKACAPGTGILYRGTVSQKGEFTPSPILGCVADLQVIFLLDTSNDGVPMRTNDISGFDAEGIREHVKEVRVYLLAQVGKKDPGYNYPVSDPQSVFVVGDKTWGRVWSRSDLEATFTGEWLHYHWKLYTIAVQPRNLE